MVKSQSIYLKYKYMLCVYFILLSTGILWNRRVHPPADLQEDPSMDKHGLQDVQWRTSSYSTASGNNCLEVAFLPDAVALGDSEKPQDPALIVSPGVWEAFVRGAKDGEFDQ